jgi:L-cysteate sulfo-lyase
MNRPNPIKPILDRYPTAGLTIAPTPTYRLERLSRFLHANIYIKRDDLTGFGLGGNKVRKLDYLLGDALRSKADTLITWNASSFSRNAAIAGRALGFEVHVFVAGDEFAQNSASQRLFGVVGSKIHFAATNDLEAESQKMAALLRRQGRNVYELHPGGSDRLGALSYVKAFDEIREFSAQTGIHFDKIVHATGSAGTQAGLVTGQCLCGYRSQTIGMAISQRADVQKLRVVNLVNKMAAMLDVEVAEDQIIVDDNYIGPGYPLPSPDGERAAEAFACLEGILLDQRYGAKAAAGLIDYCRGDRFASNENVLYLHTGGNFDLFY